ncbi:MAG TPA: formylglycine-generating enzyme family protein [Hydrogenophaga sp.]|nr:formylglycine-generating enzyme family protein [Hydrogenophaga sp.]
MDDKGAKQAGGLVPLHDETVSAATHAQPHGRPRTLLRKVWWGGLMLSGVALSLSLGGGVALASPGTKATGPAPAASTAQAPAAGSPWRDCPHCPEMVNVPGGAFAMGSPSNEDDRDEDEGPQRQVTLAAFAMGRHEVTVAQFRKFTEATGYKTDAEREPDAGCFAWKLEDEEWLWRPERSWRRPGFVQGDQHPVVCVSQNDARAYAQWLSRETGQVYRLPTEAQWEYAARAGSQSSRPWGDNAGAACRHANVADRTRPPDGSSSWTSGHRCRDGHWFTAPAGSYKANGFGLHDMIGNAWEWTLDCYDEEAYGNASALDGRAHVAASCSRFVVRGASWSSTPDKARSAFREADPASNRDDDFGFRVVRELRN